MIGSITASSEVKPLTRPKRAQHLLFLLACLLVLIGCEIAQNRVVVLISPANLSSAPNSLPNQAELTAALQEFARQSGSRCRQHVKRWDEWSCNGTDGTRITLEPDRGKNRFVAEFTLVIRYEAQQMEFDTFVDEFATFIEDRFPGAVLYLPR